MTESMPDFDDPTEPWEYLVWYALRKEWEAKYSKGSRKMRHRHSAYMARQGARRLKQSHDSQ